MKNFTTKNANAIIKEMEARMEQNGQANSIPLFDTKPQAVVFSNVTGKIVKNDFGFFQFRVFNSKGELKVGYAISGSDVEESDDATMSIGEFVALRNYTSKNSGNTFEAGKTTRDFAFTA